MKISDRKAPICGSGRTTINRILSPWNKVLRQESTDSSYALLKSQEYEIETKAST